MVKKDFISISDHDARTINHLIRQAYNLKAQARAGKKHELLQGESLAMIFDKPSTRTRVSFDVAMYELGGHAINITAGECGLGTRESVPDVARTLSRFCDAIMVRTFGHDIALGLAEHATVPVINGLTDLLHPCQAMADALTMYEITGDLKGVRLTYIGDANNVTNSLINLADKTGLDITVCAPKGYTPDEKILGGQFTLISDPVAAVKKADFIYTDVWASMGQEKLAAQKNKAFKDYQVNSQLLKKAPKNVKIMHCLPAHRGLEITDEVIDHPEKSIVFEQAENRLHAQKAILVYLLK
ncbi:ornithine carbamoyltransferase [Candidatus Termititenax persephonae]|uniref:Ornithine carbamoyltransferase n=1 Tax=Candidatus Termititenax persephonae TaxID=2218525 RepID=A0A388TEB2_9BACT|nr:ornithine carbamoyltransferase [Candidatus Termititenax persephonae]